MSESSSHISIEQSSPKSFGIVFSVVFLIVSLYPLISSEGFRVWALVVSFIFLSLITLVTLEALVSLIPLETS